MISAALIERDFANSARFYRMAYSARALACDMRNRHEDAELLTEGADAAGELAQIHTETAMFLFSVGVGR